MTKEIQANMLTHGAIAIFAGALGCVVTLFAVGAFDSKEAVLDEPSETNALPLAAAESALTSEGNEELTLEQLETAVNEAQLERSQMAETLVQMSRELANAQQQIATLEESTATQLALASANTQEQPVTGEAGGRFGFGGRQSGEQRLSSMLAAGIDEQTARDLQIRRDQHQLARLELFDQAAREGWEESELLNERLAELDAKRVDLRDELGDDAYDRYLFESGAPNRVNIASVITGSAAEIAGLEVGDLITTYDNERVFRVRELQEATRSGTKGEYVQILFDRGGRLLSADIPRGPMGVTLSTSRVMP